MFDNKKTLKLDNFLHLSVIVKYQQNKIELVTRPVSHQGGRTEADCPWSFGGPTQKSALSKRGGSGDKESENHSAGKGDCYLPLGSKVRENAGSLTSAWYVRNYIFGL